jgi:hypothetical protein
VTRCPLNIRVHQIPAGEDVGEYVRFSKVRFVTLILAGRVETKRHFSIFVKVRKFFLAKECTEHSGSRSAPREVRTMVYVSN